MEFDTYKEVNDFEKEVYEYLKELFPNEPDDVIEMAANAITLKSSRITLKIVNYIKSNCQHSRNLHTPL